MLQPTLQPTFHASLSAPTTALPRAGTAPLGRGRAPWTALLLASATALLGCGAEPEGPRSRVAMEPCFVPGVRAPAKCGTVSVPEDPAAPSGRKIELQVVVLPALASAPEPDPVFFLAGGPGQAATQIAGFAIGAADRLRERRDFVFVDQRGTGHSNGLFCEALPEDAPLADHFQSEFDPADVAWCRDRQDADLRMYTTNLAMDDLDVVRDALGYTKINLWGVSYGTRAALAYLRQHGDHARSAVLDSVAPMSLYLPLSLAKDAERALDRTFEDCAKEAACNKAFPDLRSRFHTFVARLEAEPLRARVSHPVTGAHEEVVIDRRAFLGALRGFLYSADLASLVPLALDRAMAGEPGTFVTMAREMASGVDRTMAMGMFLSVVCSEDIPFIAPGDMEREAAGTLFGPDAALEIARACTLWPKVDVPRTFRDPVESDVPVLLLSGDLDPVTPPRWAEEATGTLRRSKSVVFTGTGHNAAVTACARRIAASFVSGGTEQKLDTTCAGEIPRPRFFATFAGAP